MTCRYQSRPPREISSAATTTYRTIRRRRAAGIMAVLLSALFPYATGPATGIRRAGPPGSPAPGQQAVTPAAQAPAAAPELGYGSWPAAVPQRSGRARRTAGAEGGTGHLAPAAQGAHAPH